ncbi:hypothetical protein BX600DRAFT_1021 [Xylariales sp. PMI_506]|nr:hypothetical protein BX600DRAFT_1021 [Xylariales sp. PMI_506]
MRTSTIAVSAAAAFTGLALADTQPSAIITVATSHGGADSNLTNQTITVPIGSTPYTDSSALNAVSTLYLTGANGVSVDSITCTPYQATNGTGTGGLPFTSGTPSYLSTNTVVVGSIVCLSSDTTTITTNSDSISSSSSSGFFSASSYSSYSTVTAPFPTGTGYSGSSGNGTASNGTTSVALSTKPTPTPTTLTTTVGTTTGSGFSTSTASASAAMAVLPDMPYLLSGMLLGVASVMFSL